MLLNVKIPYTLGLPPQRQYIFAPPLMPTTSFVNTVLRLQG